MTDIGVSTQGLMQPWVVTGSMHVTCIRKIMYTANMICGQGKASKYYIVAQ